MESFGGILPRPFLYAIDPEGTSPSNKTGEDFVSPAQSRAVLKRMSRKSLISSKDWSKKSWAKLLRFPALLWCKISFRILIMYGFMANEMDMEREWIWKA